jgi:beta-lactamase superfamily II metal-dependent hydrolase
VYFTLTPNEDDQKGDLVVSFIDVGSGDAILIETPDGKCVLVDSGRPEYASQVVDYIEGKSITTIDAFIVTHPDEDHIGGAADVLASFDVLVVYHPGYPKNTNIYLNTFLPAVSAEGCPVYTDEQIDPGDPISLDSSVTFLVLHIDADASDSNSASIVIKMSYGSVDFLFMGDVDDGDESDLVYGTSFDLDIEILKVTHHGSAYGTSEAFLDAATPALGVICVGENTYGHPADVTLVRLESYDVQVYRTDLEGTVVVTTDGSTWQVS